MTFVFYLSSWIQSLSSETALTVLSGRDGLNTSTDANDRSLWSVHYFRMFRDHFCVYMDRGSLKYTSTNRQRYCNLVATSSYHGKFVNCAGVCYYVGYTPIFGLVGDFRTA